MHVLIEENIMADSKICLSAMWKEGVKREEDASHAIWERKNKPWCETYEQDFKVNYASKIILSKMTICQQQTASNSLE